MRLSKILPATLAALLIAGAAQAAPQDRDHDKHRGPQQHHRQAHREPVRHSPPRHDNHHSNKSHSSFSISYFSGVFAPRPVYYQPAPIYPATYNYGTPYYVPSAPQPVSYNYEEADDDGRYCREYTRQVNIGGRVQTSYGTACMQPDGQWEIQS